MKHREMNEQKRQEIPFPFYRDSISLFQASLARISMPPAWVARLSLVIFSQHDPDGGAHECRWKAFFRERKIDHFVDLKESERTRLSLSARCPQMINA